MDYCDKEIFGKIPTYLEEHKVENFKNNLNGDWLKGINLKKNHELSVINHFINK